MFAVCSVDVTNGVPGRKETMLAAGGDPVRAADNGGDRPPPRVPDRVPRLIREAIDTVSA
jgi:hypothetical protein